MTKIRFQYSSQLGGSSRPTNPLLNIKQAMEPPVGPHLEFLTARGWPFAGDPNAARRTTVLSQTYFDLQDAGLLDSLDFLYLSNGFSASGSLKNWIQGRPDMGRTATGAGRNGAPLTTDGVQGYFTASLAAEHRSHFQIDSASIFAYCVEAPSDAAGATTPLIGSDLSSVRLSRNTNSPFALVNINSNGRIDLVPTFSASPWTKGLWGGDRSAVTKFIHNGEVIQTGTPSPLATSIPSNVYLGAHTPNATATFGAQKFTAFGAGKSLTDAQWVSLNRILADHATVMQAISS